MHDRIMVDLTEAVGSQAEVACGRLGGPPCPPGAEARARTRRPARGALLAAASAALVAACSPPAPPASEEAREAELPTADPFARGYVRDDFPRVQGVAPGVFTYEQLRSAGDEWFTTVSLFVVTPEGVLVADGQGSLEETERLLAHIGEVTDRPVTDLVIGSDHGDHTAGNAAFPSDVRVWAHPTSDANLRAAGPDGGGARLPTDLVTERTVVELGGRTIELLFLGRAHTGGDLSVYLPSEKILFMSEAYLHRVFPAMRTAYPSEWVRMIERAQALDVDLYVPGHGFVDGAEVLEAELEVFRRAIGTVIAEATRLHDAGVPLEAAMEQASFGDLEGWSLRAGQGPRAVQQVYAEREGRLR